MDAKEAVKLAEYWQGIARQEWSSTDRDAEALAVLRRAEPVLEAVEKALPDLLYGDAYGTISGSGASVLIAALAYLSAK